MSSISLSTERLRFLLGEINEKGCKFRLFPAKDIPGPGGGVYVTSQTPLIAKHLDWIESRNPSPDSETFLEVVFIREGEAPSSAKPMSPPKQLDLPAKPPASEEEREKRARTHSKQVVTKAKAVAAKAEKIHKSVGVVDFSVADLQKADVQSGLREFERSFVQFHAVVRQALDEYLDGNTLVMDLILKYQLDKPTVQHALSVAAFASEMTALLALRDTEDGEYLESYFGELSNEELFSQLGLPEPPERPSEDEVRDHRYELFRNDLVEVFLGGFMHDCGLWSEPFYLQEGHEIKGAKLISEVPEVQKFAPTLAKIVLFHSDIVRLAKKHGVVKITERPSDPAKMGFKSEFYDSMDDARVAIELRHGKFHAEVLSHGDLRRILPVALAEHFVSHTQDVYRKSDAEVITSLAKHVSGGPFQKYVVVLCNSQVEVIAPRRSLVNLSGHISVMVVDKKESRKPQRLEVDGFDAGSLDHGSDRNSPHLITLFMRHGDGSREKAEYVSALDQTLWERSAGTRSRMYIPAGRYRNNLSFKVTGFMSEEVFARVLGEYEQECRKRIGV